MALCRVAVEKLEETTAQQAQTKLEGEGVPQLLFPN